MGSLRLFMTIGLAGFGVACAPVLLGSSGKVGEATPSPGGSLSSEIELAIRWEPAEPIATFSTSDPLATSFECRISGGNWTACASPYSLTSVPRGETASFEVRAVGAGDSRSAAVKRDFRRGMVTQGLGSAVTTMLSWSPTRLLVGGGFRSFDPEPTRGLIMLKPDGTLDRAFAPDGMGFNDAAYFTNEFSDGKIFVTGPFTAFDGRYAGRVLVLDPHTMKREESFNADGTGLNNLAWGLAPQSQNRLLLGGPFTSYNGNTVGNIVRIQRDGRFDGTFNAGGAGFNGTVYSITPLPDGRLWVMGGFTTYNGVARAGVAILSADGALDPFVLAGTAFNVSPPAQVFPSGSGFVAFGNFTSYNGTAVGRVAKLNSDGTINTSFNSGGSGFNGAVSESWSLANGKWLAMGSFTSYNGTAVGHIARLNADGSLDATFNAGGAGLSSYVGPSRWTGTSLYFVSGGATYNGQATGDMVHLDANGNLDSAFPKIELDDTCRSFNLLSDGRLLLGAYHFGSNFDLANKAVGRIVAYDMTTGLVDSSFNTGGVGADSSVMALAKQDLGGGSAGLLVGGAFANYNGVAAGGLMRLYADGRRDTTFGGGGVGVAGGAVDTILPLAGGRVLVGGAFTSYNGTSVGRLAALNAQGVLDTSFNASGSGFNGEVLTVATDATNRLWVGGLFTSYNGTGGINRLAVLNPDGTRDTVNFVNGSGFNGTVRALLPLSDGRVLVGGDFTTYKGSTAERFVMLDAHGSIDSTFSGSGIAFNGPVRTLQQTANGQFLIGGSFSTYKGVTAIYHVRLNADGTIDNSLPRNFMPWRLNSAPGYAGVNTMLLLPDQRLMAGGFFPGFGTELRTNILELEADGSLGDALRQGAWR